MKLSRYFDIIVTNFGYPSSFVTERIELINLCSKHNFNRYCVSRIDEVTDLFQKNATCGFQEKVESSAYFEHDENVLWHVGP